MITPESALTHFTDTVSTWHGASLALIASAALCFAVAKPETALAATSRDLLAAVTEKSARGRSSVYAYIGLARRVYARLRKEFPAEEGKGHPGKLGEIIDARSPNKATSLILEYMTALGGSTLDKLKENLQFAVRAKPQPSDGGTKPERQPRKASTESIVATAQASTPRDFLALMEELADSIADIEIATGARDIWQARIDTLAEEAAREKRTAKRGKKEVSATVQGVHG